MTYGAWPIIPQAAPCLKQALEAFEQNLYGVKDRSPHTLTAYGKDVSEFLYYLVNVEKVEVIALTTLKGISIQTLRSFLSFLREGDRCQPSTVTRKISSLRTFYRFLETHLGVKNDSIQVLRLPRKARLLPKPVSKENANELLDFLDQTQTNWILLRDRSLIGLLYGCGLRLAEVLSLRQGSQLGEHIMVLGKRNKERMVPLLPVVRQWVEQYKQHCPYLRGGNMWEEPAEKRALFYGVRGLPLHPRQVRFTLTHLRRRLGLSEKITPHSFRHAFATHLLQAGANLRQVQELLGHASIRSTQIYTEVTQGDVLRQYRAAHPRESSSGVKP